MIINDVASTETGGAIDNKSSTRISTNNTRIIRGTCQNLPAKGM